MADDVPAFEVRGLSADYGGARVLSGLDLSLPAGRFTVLLGPNGSGKSTLLRCLGRLLRPRAGAVLHAGRAIAAMPSRELARQVGVLAQGPTAPEGLTVRDLVEQGRYPHRTLFGQWSEADRQACAEAMRLTATADLADRPLDALSGGQRQRVWIAMTLAQETGTLLLDEPTTFLDVSHQIEVLELLRRLVARGRTVVAVLHDINQAARYADHLALLDGGRIRAAGPPASVLTPAIIREVFSVRMRVIPDPETGAPLCIPRRTQPGETDKETAT